VPLSTPSRDALFALRYARAAHAWTDALPVGNGTRGAMCGERSGGLRLWLNDITAWSGPASDDPLAGVQDAGPAALAAVRDAIARDDLAEAQRLLQRQQTPWVQAYLPLAHVDVEVSGEAEPDCRRELDLHRGIATLAYTAGGASVLHETWADIPSGALVHRITADVPVAVTVTIGSLLRAVRTPRDEDGDVVAEWMLPVDVAPGHEQPAEPIRYDPARGRTGAVAVRAQGRLDGDRLILGAARTHLIVIGTATAPGLPGEDDERDAATRAIAVLDAFAPADTATAHAAHAAAHAELMDRCVLDLPSPADVGELDTDARVARALTRDDPGLAALVFHYGRYLLAASTRHSPLPLTLQGLWNAELPGPWSCAYTTNINLQMAYWPAETTALPECHEPLLRFVERVAATTGPEVARRLYSADGWVLHHNSDPWGHAAPVGAGHGDVAWAFWPLGGVWLAVHLWDRFTFDGDLDALRTRAWPVFEATARFALSWIQTDGTTAWTSPSTSPENRFVDGGGVYGVGTTSTMDVALFRELARVCRDAAAALDRDDGWVDELERVTALLPDPAVTDGRLQEWNPPRVDEDPHHRHLSHLVGLFPFAQITPERTPALAAAAVETITARGLESTGWALAWRAALWARLGDGERFGQQIAMSLRPAGNPGGTAGDGDGTHRGGLYPNLFSAHPPFQIDGNLGVTAAIAEALVQSHDGVLRILPALPTSWPDGAVRGLRARGGVGVDIEWTDGRARSIHLRADRPSTIEVRVRGWAPRRVDLAPGDPLTIDSRETAW